MDLRWPRTPGWTVGLARTAVVLAALLAPATTTAVDMTSPSYRSLSGHFSAGGPATATSTAPLPSFGRTAATIGEAGVGGPGGSSADLRSVLPGFWRVVLGGAPSIDIDADLEQAFLDEDDDGDGLDDLVETNTGIFVSAGDTGTDPLLADTDGDGLADGIEVAIGANPNDPLDPAPAVPALPLLFQGVLSCGLGLLGTSAARKAQVARRPRGRSK